jgi:hypothetical protein
VPAEPVEKLHGGSTPDDLVGQERMDVEDRARAPESGPLRETPEDAQKHRNINDYSASVV